MTRILLAALAAAVLTAFPASAQEHDYLYNFFDFGGYPAEVVDLIEPAQLDRTSTLPYWEHLDAIVEARLNGPNYAGHYAVTTWGCGTECQTGVAIDLLTGVVTEFPTTSYGASFYPDSRLLVTNTDIGGLDSDIPEWLTHQYFVIEGNQFVFLRDRSARNSLVDGGE